MLIYSFEKDKIIEDLKLPDHMFAIELGDLMIYCTSCSEGKFIQSYGDEIYKELGQEFRKTQFKIDDPEFDEFISRVSEHFCNKVKEFTDRHRNCLPLEENKRLFSLNCLM